MRLVRTVQAHVYFKCRHGTKTVYAELPVEGHINGRGPWIPAIEMNRVHGRMKRVKWCLVRNRKGSHRPGSSVGMLVAVSWIKFSLLNERCRNKRPEGLDQGGPSEKVWKKCKFVQSVYAIGSWWWMNEMLERGFTREVTGSVP